jgi:hypothetical protein
MRNGNRGTLRFSNKSAVRNPLKQRFRRFAPSRRPLKAHGEGVWEGRGSAYPHRAPVGDDLPVPVAGRTVRGDTIRQAFSRSTTLPLRIRRKGRLEFCTKSMKLTDGRSWRSGQNCSVRTFLWNPRAHSGRRRVDPSHTSAFARNASGSNLDFDFFAMTDSPSRKTAEPATCWKGLCSLPTPLAPSGRPFGFPVLGGETGPQKKVEWNAAPPSPLPQGARGRLLLDERPHATLAPRTPRPKEVPAVARWPFAEGIR